MFIKHVIISSPVEKKYRLERDSHGNCIYTECGELNISDYVNSFRNTSALDAVLQRIQYMPICQMQQSLQMVQPGIYCDMTHFPKEATDALLLLKKYEHQLPVISQKLKTGESLDSIFKAMFTPKSTVKENTTNGEVKSSNE